MVRRSVSSFVWMLVLVSLTMSMARPVTGQEQGQEQESSPAAGTETPPRQVSPEDPPPSPSLEVVGVRSLGEDPNSTRLGDRIEIQVKGLGDWLANSAQRCEGLVLFLGGLSIKGVEPASCDPHADTVYFTLARTAESSAAWLVLLEEPLGFSKQIQVSVGPEGGLAFPTQVRKFRLEILPKTEFFGALSGIVFLLAVLVYLARRSNLLRDRGSLGLPPGKLASYSLSRFQLAFWSFLVLAAYLFIWMVTGELNTITGSVLALLGIGAGTALGARLVDAEAGTTDPASPAPAETNASPAASQGFLRDILSDEQGISLHRFQLFVWTLVLGIIFIADVYTQLTMPQFSTTLLGLMGISSGTYLGFKVPENRAPEAPEKG